MFIHVAPWTDFVNSDFIFGFIDFVQDPPASNLVTVTSRGSFEFLCIGCVPRSNLQIFNAAIDSLLQLRRQFFVCFLGGPGKEDSIHLLSSSLCPPIRKIPPCRILPFLAR